MLVSDFDFALPEELVAQEPPVERGSSRMLLLDRGTGAWHDSSFVSLPLQLRAGDVLVLNDSRVVPARLFGRRRKRPVEIEAATGPVEVLLVQQRNDWEWTALVRPGRKLRVGDSILFSEEDDGHLEAEVIATGERGERTLRFAPVENFDELLDRLGHMPLPPYIHRHDEAADQHRYQTVYAKHRGSAAAPTAGLHFTPTILQEFEERGVHIRHITLHVGLGTFQPVREADTANIHLHSERYTLPPDCAEAINLARKEKRRIIAVGTTVVRTLEHCASLASDGRLEPHRGSTNVFLGPGYRFRLVNALLTNFHLPQSTLLMLVCAFAGRDNILAAYRHAVQARYRFFSYGDCMFIS